MRAHVVAEERFLHQGMEHRLFACAVEPGGNEFRFEAIRFPSGSDHPETVFERLIDFTGLLAQCPNTTIDQLVEAELDGIKSEIFSEEELHIHDP